MLACCLSVFLVASGLQGICKLWIRHKYDRIRYHMLHRPDWRAVFQTVCMEYPKDTVGVFCCGPLGLTQDLKVLSR